MNGKKKFISNLLVAFLSQGTSLIMSMLMTLILPKMLGVDQYSYSQLFIFYVGYVGLLHFGVNDGLYLRLGGKNIDDINNQRLGNEFRMFLLFECLVAIGIALLGLFIVSDYNRRFIVLAVAIAIVISNMTSFLGYLFQAVNETKWYSYSVMIDRIFVIVFMIVLLVLHITAFEPFVISYVVSKGIALAYCICKGKNIVFVKASNYRLAVSDVWLDVCIGIKLTISNIVSMLILGFGRKIIDIIWGIASFGKISLSFSLTNFFLVFIQQISMVMFPALRRVTEHLQKEVYIILRAAINILAPAILILYIPMEYVLGLWLPQYKESLHYLGFLLPICIFDGKMQMLFTTYFKVFRQEKILMKINIASCIFSVITCSYIYWI